MRLSSVCVTCIVPYVLFLAGVRCVAVSLLDYHRSPVYALSISAPASRMDRERILELKDALLEIKGELMAAMGLEDGRRKL